MAVCDYCGKTITWVDVFHCKYCGRNFCIKHRIPEDHRCTGHPINTHLGGRRDYFKTKYVGTSYGHRDFEETHRPVDIIEKDSRRKKYRPFRGGSRIHYGIELKHILLILAFIGLLVFINFNLDTVMNYFQPEEIVKEEIEQPIQPEEEVTKVHGKTLLIPVEGQSCQEIFSKPDKTVVIKSLCSALCETRDGEFLGQSNCMGDKKLYCKCQLYEEIITPKEVYQPEEVVQEEPEIQEPSGSESVSDKTYEIEKLIFKYTNIKRQENGVSELSWDDTLAKIAREHSEDMATNDFFSHTNLKGEDPTDRAIRNGYDVHKSLGGGWYSEGIAENIGKMPTGNVLGYGYVSSNPDSIAKAHVESWMESPGHRENILNTQYDVIGVGVAYDGLYYIATQDFK